MPKIFNDTFTESERKRIVKITGVRLVEDEKRLEDFVNDAVYFEDYHRYCVFVFKYYSSNPMIIRDKIEEEVQEDKTRKFDSCFNLNLWREYFEKREIFASKVLPVSNLLLCESNYDPRWPNLGVDQYGVRAYLLILPEDIPKLIEEGITPPEINYAEMYSKKYELFTRVYTCAEASLQLKIVAELADDEDVLNFLQNNPNGVKKQFLLDNAKFNLRDIGIVPVYEGKNMKSSENKEKIALPELLRKRKPIIHFSDDSDNSEDIEKIAESYVVFEKTGETIYNFPEKKSLESYILVEWKGYNDEGLFDGLALALVNLVEIHNAIEISKGTNIQCPDFQLSSKSKVLSEYFKYANYVVVSKPTKVEVDSFGTVLRSNLEFYCALTADDIALLINNDEVTPDTSLSNIATDKFDSFVEIFSKLSAEKQKITYHELSDKLEDSQKTTLLKDASFDIMDVIDEEEGYISHWELIENSRYFSDNNKLLEFAQQMACSSLPETDWDEQKDTFLESILNNLGINLDKQRRRKIHDKISGEISQLKMEKQRGHAEIQSSSRVVIRESGINISGELTFERGSLIYDTYLAAVKKVSQNKYWKFEDTTASVKITHPHNTYFIVDIVLTHPLWQKVRESYSRISDSHNLERILYSGEHEKIAQEISEILQRTSAHDLNTLRENISPISITEKVHSLCISYEQGKVYYFAEDTSICIDFRENADNQSFNLYNINVANDSSEKVFSQLIISGFLKWDVDKVNEDVNSFEREAAGALVGMQKNRMLSKYEDSKRYKQLCYYQVELANGRIPQLLDIQHDISLIRQVNNKSVLFNDAYEKLVEYYKNLERENGSDVLNQSPSNSVIQNIL